MRVRITQPVPAARLTRTAVAWFQYAFEATAYAVLGVWRELLVLLAILCCGLSVMLDSLPLAYGAGLADGMVVGGAIVDGLERQDW